jgi:hypothetical protein
MIIIRCYLTITFGAVAAALTLRGQTNKAQTKARPILLITGGPTGSGKSGLPEATEATVTGKITYQPFLIDDLVEQAPMFKAQVMHILHRLMDGANDLHKLEETLSHPSQELLDEFDKAYFDARRSGDCGHPDEAPNLKGCSEVFKKRLEVALANKANIVFETTVGYPSWLVDKTNGEYDVYYVASLVDFCRLVPRNTGRAFKMAKRFLADPEHSPAARLTPVGDGFADLVDEFFGTIQKLWGSDCLRRGNGDANAAVCGHAPLTALLLFDNNGDHLKLKAKLTRDSTDEEFGRATSCAL